ncbi:MAG: aconitate hydratase, partial [Dehalococcoidia bacterium]
SDLRESLTENNEVYDFLQSAAAKYGVGFWGPGAGIIHQVNLEQYAFPGAMIIGTDSHTPNAGGLGACSVGVGGADAVEVMAGLPWEVLYPNRIGVLLTGQMSGWTAPKDVILYLVGVLTVSGGTNSIIEYFGPGTQTISCTGKATIANMGAEMGASTSVFPYDESMARYLRATRRGELARLADQNRDMLAPDQEVVDHPESYFDRIVEIDLSRLEPHVVGPHSPDRARPISAMAREVKDEANGFVDQISSALIGSCTNSSYEDMSRAADVAEQARAIGIQAVVPLMVTPGSEQVRATIERDGQLESLRAIGGTVLANACGPCIGQWRRSRDASEVPNTIVTSYNRNFPRRNDGQPQTMNFLTSPEITTALALAGRLSFNPLTDTLTDGHGNQVKLAPPRPAPDVPERDFDAGHANYIAPPEDGSGIEIVVAPDSGRLQLMEPWSPWDGKDIVDVPVLMKVQGKCTTDHISPAGPWLSLRGHLDKFSDNLLMGATNAYTGEAGKGLDVLTGKKEQVISVIARHYKAEGLKWVVIGDDNYGEGSSREHAALSPRLLGAAAVIARSFARIHETNLKKQGLLPLTFSNPDDYDRIREDDRLSLTGLKDLAPDKPVACTVHHSDGTTETLSLNHSFGESQIEWFRVGSALNLFHR